MPDPALVEVDDAIRLVPASDLSPFAALLDGTKVLLCTSQVVASEARGSTRRSQRYKSVSVALTFQHTKCTSGCRSAQLGQEAK